jgi:hypothetical protein
MLKTGGGKVTPILSPNDPGGNFAHAELVLQSLYLAGRDTKQRGQI